MRCPETYPSVPGFARCSLPPPTNLTCRMNLIPMSACAGAGGGRRQQQRRRWLRPGRPAAGRARWRRHDGAPAMAAAAIASRCGCNAAQDPLARRQQPARAGRSAFRCRWAVPPRARTDRSACRRRPHCPHGLQRPRCARTRAHAHPPTFARTHAPFPPWTSRGGGGGGGGGGSGR